jgi:hypothetical protein
MDIIGFIAGLFNTKRRQADIAAIAEAQAKAAEGDWTPEWAKN